MEVKKTHLKTFDPRVRDFSGEWVDINMRAMHKNTVSPSVQMYRTACWRVDSIPQLYAKKQLLGCTLPADVR